MSVDNQRTMTRQASWTRFRPLQHGEFDAYTRACIGDGRNHMERIPEQPLPGHGGLPEAVEELASSSS